MKIILDTMGGDHGAAEFVKGAYLALRERDVEIVFVGAENELSALMKEQDPDGKYSDKITVVNATEVVDMNDDPIKVIKQKPDASMTVAMKYLADGNGDALISSGSTGALLTQATLIVKRVRGIRRAALSPIIPTATGMSVLIDSGANADCTAEYLYQFALMGSIYAERAIGLKSPKVGLLNNGAEEHKGDAVHQETYQLLTKAHGEKKINFIGNIEGRDGPLGKADVIVADGFSGNIYLKTIEGVGMFFARELKGMFMSSLKGKIAGLLVKKNIGGFKKKIDYNTAGGAPLLGIKKPVIKAHGSAIAVSIYHCIGQAVDYANSGMADVLAQHLSEERGSNE